jgi:hypothetical protein
MSDQRKEVRKKLMAFTPVYDTNQKVLLGYVRNLSLLGVMVVGEKTVEIDTDRLLKIEFPGDLPGLASERVTIPARAVWCRQDESLKYYNTGFEFALVTPEHAAIFEAIMARYQFRQDIPR